MEMEKQLRELLGNVNRLSGCRKNDRDFSSGVNGVGKTTTIGVGVTFPGAGQKVMLAAGDTFGQQPLNGEIGLTPKSLLSTSRVPILRQCSLTVLMRLCGLRYSAL